VGQDDGKTPEAHLAMKARMPGGPRHTITSLAVMVKATERGLWPTPSATLGSHAGLVTPAKGRGGGTLVEAVSQRMWPTPTVQDAENNAPPLNSVIGGALNPTWVEWLMGFPLGWTDCAASGTPSSPR
jgi:hypothetical protein